MINMVKKVIFLAATAVLSIPSALFAQSDWVVRDFQATITVNKDSSLTIEERITADADSLPDKHGIFRIVPTQTRTDKGAIKTPVSLVSITDFNGQPVKYSQSTDNFNHTITWKIGDPDITVTGLNYYKITYLVKNAIRSQNSQFDELYWNLSGNFWDIDIDKFTADIVFPPGIEQNNSRVYLYSGNLGDKSNDLAAYDWSKENVLQVSSTKTLAPRRGITASITLPKGIITPYQPGFFDMYGDYLWFLIPFIIFLAAWRIWLKYGKDPRVDKTVIPEFEIPENLTPMEMGLLASNGIFSDKLISATIVDLAVKKRIIIEEVPKTGIFGKTDFRLKKSGDGFVPLGDPETMLFVKIFGTNLEVLLSDLKKDFYKDLPEVKKASIEDLKQKGLIYQSGLTLKIVLLVLAFALFGLAIFGAIAASPWLGGALAISGIILLVFGLFMPKRTQKGAELNWRVRGFRLYMETAEKYRAQFNEKENIFEKFLPYAIVFGIAKLWAKKMEMIYGKEYFAAYHPAWYAGASITSFNADSFASQISGLSAGIASNIGTASGASGAGAAGGGGGGGGGGGW